MQMMRGKPVASLAQVEGGRTYVFACEKSLVGLLSNRAGGGHSRRTSVPCSVSLTERAGRELKGSFLCSSRRQDLSVEIRPEYDRVQPLNRFSARGIWQQICAMVAAGAA